MKLDNKGFAISSIMYVILVMALILVALLLALLNSRKLILDRQKKSLVEKYEIKAIDEVPVVEYSQVGSYEYTVLKSGLYKIELWGAQGGDATDNPSICDGTSVNYCGGKGAYTSGIITLTIGEKLYFYVGGKGNYQQQQENLGGYNGGGASGSYSSGYSAGGGGSTDVRLVGGTWSNFGSLKSRIMVAAGGGGSVKTSSYNVYGGYGGALVGGSVDGSWSGNPPAGATQTSGGKYPSGYENKVGSFGYAYQTNTSNNGWGGGGGGGYYGGGQGQGEGGSGGSSYISGYVGCDSIAQSSTSGSIVHTTLPIHYSGKYFSNPVMISGDTSMIQPDGTTTIGHSQDGYARITYIGTQSGDGREYTYNYTSGEQTFIAPQAGYYKLEVWGAQGGSPSSTYFGGYGGYSSGIAYLNSQTSLYVNVGGAGASCTTGDSCIALGGYNGGGDSKSYTGSGSSAAGGGGATHISTQSGLLSSLSSNVQSIYIVAGGGGGGNYTNGSNFGNGGAGGGITGGSSQDYGANSYGSDSISNAFGMGGTQSAGGCRINNSNNCGSFGQGYSDTTSSGGTANSGGGGGGYYGGGGTRVNAGGGGSGYIGNSSLLSKYMSCYNCASSLASTTYTIQNSCSSSTAKGNCSKEKNGFAKITKLNINRVYDPSGINDTSSCSESKLSGKTVYDISGGLPYTYLGKDSSKSTVTCTGLVLDWDKDIIIDISFETQNLGSQRYSLASSYDYINLQSDYSNKEMFFEVTAEGKLSVFFGGRTNDTTNNITYRKRYTSSGAIVNNNSGTYRAMLYWDSKEKSISAFLTDGTTIVSLDAQDAFLSDWSGKSNNPLLIGAGDYRTTKYFYTITLNSVSIYN